MFRCRRSFDQRVRTSRCDSRRAALCRLVTSDDGGGTGGDVSHCLCSRRYAYSGYTKNPVVALLIGIYDLHMLCIDM